jgi:hypothetical protein
MARLGKTRQGFNEVVVMEDLKRIMVPAGHSVVTAKLIEVLQRPSKIGDVISDEDLTDACGRDTRTGQKGYNNLCRAINFVLNHNGLVWKRLRDADAIKRLSAPEIEDVAKRATTSIGRAARKNVTKLQCVPLDDVPETDRTRFTSLIAQHGAIAAFSKPDIRKKLEVREGVTFDPAKALAAFTRKNANE